MTRTEAEIAQTEAELDAHAADGAADAEAQAHALAQETRPKRRAPNAAPAEQDEFLMERARQGVKARDAVEEFMATFLPFTEEGAAERKRVKSLYQHRLRRVREDRGLQGVGSRVKSPDESTPTEIITTGGDVTIEAGAGTTLSVNGLAGSRAAVQPGDEILVRPTFARGTLAPNCEHAYTLEWGTHADEMRRAAEAYEHRHRGITVPDSLAWDERVCALIDERDRAVAGAGERVERAAADAFSRGQAAALEGVRDVFGFSCEAAKVISEVRHVIEQAREGEADMRRQRDEALQSCGVLRMRYQPGDWELVFARAANPTVPGVGRIPLIKAIREVTGLGLKESKDLCDAGWDGRAPQVLLRGLSEASACTLASGLQSAGAVCEVRCVPQMDFWLEATRVLGQALGWRYDFAGSLDKRGIFEEMCERVAEDLKAQGACRASGDGGQVIAAVAQALSTLAALAPQQQDLIAQRDARIEALEAHVEDLRRQAGLR